MKANKTDYFPSYWQMTQEIANYVFTSFKNDGYEPSDIYYFNPEPLPDIDEDGTPDQMVVDDFTPTATELIEIITNWPQDHIANDGPLYIYLIGHGADDSFLIMPSEVIAAKELRNTIDAFQNGYTDDEGTYHIGTNRQVIVIIESAASSTFIDDLTGPNITVITSTDHGASFIKPMFNGADSNDPKIRSFTTAFVTDSAPFLNPGTNDPVIINNTLTQAFLSARDTLENWGPPFIGQYPQMALPDTPYVSLTPTDSDGDGVPDYVEGENDWDQDGIMDKEDQETAYIAWKLCLDIKGSGGDVFYNVGFVDQNFYDYPPELITQSFLLYEVLRFSIEGFEENKEVVVDIGYLETLPYPPILYTYYDDNGWQGLSYENLDSNTVTITLKDGEVGDRDGDNNGTITTFLAFTYPKSIEEELKFEGQSFGCFISTLAQEAVAFKIIKQIPTLR